MLMKPGRETMSNKSQRQKRGAHPQSRFHVRLSVMYNSPRDVKYTNTRTHTREQLTCIFPTPSVSLAMERMALEKPLRSTFIGKQLPSRESARNSATSAPPRNPAAIFVRPSRRYICGKALRDVCRCTGSCGLRALLVEAAILW